jgi:hypothetical protein
MGFSHCKAFGKIIVNLNISRSCGVEEGEGSYASYYLRMGKDVTSTYFVDVSSFSF